MQKLALRIGQRLRHSSSWKKTQKVPKDGHQGLNPTSLGAPCLRTQHFCWTPLVSHLIHPTVKVSSSVLTSIHPS